MHTIDAPYARGREKRCAAAPEAAAEATSSVQPPTSASEWPYPPGTTMATATAQAYANHAIGMAPSAGISSARCTTATRVHSRSGPGTGSAAVEANAAPSSASNNTTPMAARRGTAVERGSSAEEAGASVRIRWIFAQTCD